MAKPNFQFEKRQRELEKKKKNEEKLKKKLEKHAAPDQDAPEQAVGAEEAPEQENPQ